MTKAASTIQKTTLANVLDTLREHYVRFLTNDVEIRSDATMVANVLLGKICAIIVIAKRDMEGVLARRELLL